MSNYDYAVIGAYFAMLLSVGYLTSKFVASTSDYFRAGGTMVWWIVGASAFMNQFSAWTFTGAASSAYTSGWTVGTIYLGNAFGFFLNYLYFAPRSRQMRLITTIEAVRERFGAGSQQFYTWIPLVTGIFSASIWLYGLCLFVSAAFGIPLQPTLLVTGAVVTIATLLGGSWASSANDFVQLLVLVPVTIVVAVLSLVEIGGPAAFAQSVPAGHLSLSAPFASGLLLMWCVTNLVRQSINCNNLLEAGRYLSVKNSSHARKAALLACVLSLIGPVLWFIPPMAAHALTPDLYALFPAMKNASEGAFAAVCMKVLPTGMLGLMICGILGSTMSSMDTGLNRNAGIFVRNFYLPVLRPRASEGELVLVSRITTVLIGALIIVSALNIGRLSNVGLFEIVQQFSSLVIFPMAVPLMLILVTRHAAPWAAWSTTLVCFVVSLLIHNWLTPDWLAERLGEPVRGAARNYWTAGIAVIANLTIGGSWFAFSTLFWNRLSPERRAAIEAFNQRIRTPLTDEETRDARGDNRQSSLMGNVTLVFAAFIALLCLIPNSPGGRLAFLFCSLFVAAVGLALRRSRIQETEAPDGFGKASALHDDGR